MRLKIVDSVPSTNDTLKDWLREGACEPVVLLAKHQSKGRGQFERSWESPQEMGLYMSYLLFPKGAVDLGEINLLMAEAVVSVLAGYGIKARIKLPNDIYVGERKIAGILPEAIHQGACLKGLIIGVGINLYQERRFFEERALTGTSMKIESDVPVKRELLALDIIETFNNLIQIEKEDI